MNRAQTQDKNMIEIGRALALAASLGLLLGVALPAAAVNPNAQNLYSVHKLQSDVSGEAAMTDPDLVNGWGIVASSTSPWWVSDNGTSKSTLYNGMGQKQSLVVTVPGPPTGIVFNGSTDFKVDAGTGLLAARFIFATDDGQIAGWNTVGTAAISAVTTPDAVYLGLAIGSSGGNNYLYAANFAAARIDVFNATFGDGSGDLAGDFTDPGIPAGYAPFNIQAIGGELFVAYAKQNPDEPDEELAGEGLGYVSAFGTDGTFPRPRRLAGRAERPVGPRDGTVDFRQVQRRPPRRQFRGRPDPRVPQGRGRLGGARGDEGHRPPADRDRRVVGHRLRQRRQLRPDQHAVLRGRPGRGDARPVRVDHRAVSGQQQSIKLRCISQLAVTLYRVAAFCLAPNAKHD
jgi:uncharacterized protein (TIGR03118 family)